MAEVDSFHAIRLFHRRSVKNQKMLEGTHPIHSPSAATRGGEMCPKVGPGGVTATAKKVSRVKHQAQQSSQGPAPGPAVDISF